MSIRFLHVVGQNENEIVVFEEFVGPFVNQEAIDMWLRSNGFEPNNPPSTISVGSGRLFFHKERTRSPLATDMWAREEELTHPANARINDNCD